MGERMIAAARTSGIKITLVPVFYQMGNFGTGPLPHQRRFISTSVDAYCKLLEATQRIVKNDGQAHLGFSVHSLRAVEFQDVIRTFQQGPEELPFHLHIAEQLKEVNDCLAFCGKRPVAWLLENMPVNERFHLVHATHLSDDELRKLAATGANVVLCPSTEGNLGDGIFRMKEYVKSGGHWSIGTDSHIGLNPLEEFRMLDYRQRLITHHRNTFEGDGANYLICEEIVSGRKAMGVNFGNHFALGQPMDAVVYDACTPLLGNTSLDNILSTLVYSADSSKSLGTLVDGRWIVKDQEHISGTEIRSEFSRVIREIGIRQVGIR